MARLLLLRHGQSTWNAQRRWQGWADPPLSGLGESQARAMAAVLAGGPTFAGAISSDLRRSVDTARILADELGVGAAEVEPDLRERDVGDWSGRTTDEIEDIWPGAIAAWRAGLLPGPPGGEPEVAFTARVVGAVERLASRSGGPLLVVTHGGVIRALERHLGGDPSSTANLCGRWVQGEAGLCLAQAVALPDIEEETVTAL